MHVDYARIERAIYFLTKNAEAQPSLQTLSRYLGLSEFHCHRLFKSWAGITPKDFVQFLTLMRAKALLNQSASLMDTSLRVGLSGSSRLHDLFIRYEAMTPGEFKSGAKQIVIKWGVFDSPLGFIAIAVTDRGICSLNFTDSEDKAYRTLRGTWPNAIFRKDVKILKPLSTEICRRMSGEKKKELQLFLIGTSFQVKVWEALLRIPEGSVATYQQIARTLGKPRASRAVGAAVGANPIGYLIPCHRVIKSTGIIGDYHWGTPRKMALLGAEHGRKGHPREVCSFI